jgi:hypothetical protein
MAKYYFSQDEFDQVTKTYAAKKSSDRRVNQDSSNYLVCPQCVKCDHFALEHSTAPYQCGGSSSSAIKQMFSKRSIDTVTSCADFKKRPANSQGDSKTSSGAGGFLNKAFAEDKVAARKLADSMGLGIVADAAGGIGKLAGMAKAHAAEAEAREAELERRRQEIEQRRQEKIDALRPVAEEKLQAVLAIPVDGSEVALIGGIGTLLDTMTEIKTFCEAQESRSDDEIETASRLGFNEKWKLFGPTHDTALSKIDEALERLLSMGELGKITGDFIEASIVAERPETMQKEAGKKILEKKKQKGLQAVEAILPKETVLESAESIVKLFDIIDSYKNLITAENIVGKKDRNEILGSVRLKAIEKIDTELGKLQNHGTEGNALAGTFTRILAVEKNLKFSDTTGKFHDKDHMPALARVGDMAGNVKDKLANLNPFAKKDSGSDNTDSSSNAEDTSSNLSDNIKDKLGGVKGLFGFGKKK